MQPVVGRVAAKVVVWFVVAAATFAALPSVAAAWSVSKASNGVVFARSGDDTTSVSIIEYYGDKPLTGGQTRGQYIYNSQYTSASAESVIDAITTSFEWPLAADDGFHLVYIKRSGVVEERHVIYREPLRVDLASAIPLEVSSMPPIALESSVSVDGTLPVSVEAIGDLDRSGILAAAAIAALSLGVLVYRGVRS